MSAFLVVAFIVIACFVEVFCVGVQGLTERRQTPHDPRGGTPAPGYYETFQPNGQVQERAVEMEAITAVNQTEDGDLRRASKF
jgi:hypothetical protein